MGFLVMLGLFAMVAAGIWGFLVHSKTRREAISEFRNRPWEWTFMALWIFAMFCFFFGVFLPFFGALRPFGKHGLAVWQLGGIGSAIGGLILIIVSRPKSRRK